jgi:hypothetical protein
LVSDIRAGDGKIANLFYSVSGHFFPRMLVFNKRGKACLGEGEAEALLDRNLGVTTESLSLMGEGEADRDR